MALTDLQQFNKVLSDSKYILLLFNPKDNGDALASALALKKIIETDHKQAEVVATDFILPKSLSFLPGATDVKAALTHLQKFIIKVDVAQNPIDTISYDIKDNTLSIYLTPKTGAITKHELRTASSAFKYDLIITLGIPDLESLGNIYHNNTDLFYRTTIVNIDHQPSNESYGQINLTDPNYSSLSEIIYNFLKQENNLINAEIATILLTGMTIATKSFKNQNVTPLTLQTASQLVNLGAEREKIVQHLYRTRSLSTLKLWGQALTHLKNDSQLGIVWTTLTHDDFYRSGATIENLHGLIDELISNSPEAKIIILLAEDANKKIHGVVTAEKNFDALTLAKFFNPIGHRRRATFTISDETITSAETKIISKIQEAIKNI